ncbi:hypothetical protein [Nonlabens sp. Asnod3-A02]|uniref:hypothetical protein n=1 Tax=Nonlabens sp. Asnod3-A02 TaxID=3160579 RepID=UPI00386D792D
MSKSNDKKIYYKHIPSGQVGRFKRISYDYYNDGKKQTEIILDNGKVLIGAMNEFERTYLKI